MPGQNATADKLVKWCDAAHEGQVDDIPHSKISLIADRFAKTKQEPRSSMNAPGLIACKGRRF